MDIHQLVARLPEVGEVWLLSESPDAARLRPPWRPSVETLLAIYPGLTHYPDYLDFIARYGEARFARRCLDERCEGYIRNYNDRPSGSVPLIQTRPGPVWTENDSLFQFGAVSLYFHEGHRRRKRDLLSFYYGFAITEAHEPGIYQRIEWPGAGLLRHPKTGYRYYCATFSEWLTHFIATRGDQRGLPG